MYYVLIWIEFWKKTLSRKTFMIDIFLDMKYIWLTSDTEPDLQYKGCLEKQALPDLTCLMHGFDYYYDNIQYYHIV